MHDKTVRRRRAVLALLVVISLILITASFGGSGGGALHTVQSGFLDVLSPVETEDLGEAAQDLIGRMPFARFEVPHIRR